jgi:hypothetical protein
MEIRAIVTTSSLAQCFKMHTYLDVLQIYDPETRSFKWNISRVNGYESEALVPSKRQW